MACNKRQVALAFIYLWDKYEKLVDQINLLPSDQKGDELRRAMKVLDDGFNDFEKVIKR